jgi:cardiolipin synthase
MRTSWGGALAAAALAIMAGCASVPPIDKYLMQVEPEAVRMEGARGKLSAAQSKQVIEALKKRAPASGILDAHIAIEEALAGNPLSVGNQVVLLEDGKDTYASMLGAIKAAKHHVHLEMYIFEDDEVGQAFAAALRERAAAGVQVRLIYDSVGSMGTPKSFFQELIDAKIDVVEYNPVSTAALLKNGILSQQHRDHRKLLLVDGRVSFLGGINISAVYGGVSGSGGSGRGASRGGFGGSGSGSGGSSESNDPPFEQRPWRDTQVRIEGPAVADLQRAFLQQWAKWKKEPPPDSKDYFPQLKPEGPQVVRIIDATPSAEGLNTLYVALVSAIDNAEVDVRIVNSYFVPHPDLRESLENAARRGVDVKLILPSRSDNRLVYQAGRSYYGGLLEAGVKIYERKNRVLHAKTATVDGVWATVGSTNLDWRSLAYNDELNAIVLGADFTRQANAMFDRDLAESEEITLEYWRKRPLLDRVKEIGARTWSRFL